MSTAEPCLFTLQSGLDFARKISEYLNVPLHEPEERDFEDGEHKVRPLTNVRGRAVFVIQSLYADDHEGVNDKFIRLLFLIGALKDAGADSVTAVIPYLCYARKDRKTQPRDPVNTRYVAQLLESVGTDRVVTLDVHNLVAYQNAFRCRTEHLEAKKLFVEYFAPLVQEQEVAVVSPDVGGVKRAEQFRQTLSQRLDKALGSAFMEKHRAKGVVSGETLVGDVQGKTVIIIDDMIASGGTIARTVDACVDQGAATIYAAASHGIFVGKANEYFSRSGLERLVITDTIPPFRLPQSTVQQQLEVLDTAPLFGEAIRRMVSGGSIVELLED